MPRMTWTQLGEDRHEAVGPRRLGVATLLIVERRFNTFRPHGYWAAQVRWYGDPPADAYLGDLRPIRAQAFPFPIDDIVEAKAWARAIARDPRNNPEWRRLSGGVRLERNYA